MAFDAILNEDGFISVEGQSDRKLLGTYTYDSATGTISGVFLIINTNPVYTLETLDYFINFDGETGAGVTLSGAAQFTYNWNDIQIPGYESYGLTITDEGTFIAAKKP